MELLLSFLCIEYIPHQTKTIALNEVTEENSRIQNDQNRSRNIIRLVGDSNPLRCRALQSCIEHLGGLITCSLAGLTRSILLVLMYQHIFLKRKGGEEEARVENTAFHQDCLKVAEGISMNTYAEYSVTNGWFDGKSLTFRPTLIPHTSKSQNMLCSCI